MSFSYLKKYPNRHLLRLEEFAAEIIDIFSAFRVMFNVIVRSITLVLFLLFAESAFAAPPPQLPSTVEPGHERLEQTNPSDVPEGHFDFSITAPPKTPIAKDVETLRFMIAKISVDGSTVFKHGDLLPLIEPLIGHEATLRDIMKVAEAIEARYREEGYLLTRAFVPPQRTRDGEFKIQVIEAFIKSVTVNGVEGDLKSRIAAILAPVTDERPLRSATMERALLLANDLPGVHAVGLLNPSEDEPGAADLRVDATVKLLSASASIDNRSSRYSGPTIANTDVTLDSLLNEGEQISVGVSRSIEPNKQRSVRAHYAQPIGSDGLVATTEFERTLGRPGFTLTPLGIATDSVILAERLSYPLIRNRSFSLYIDTGFSAKMAKTEVESELLSHDQWRTVDVKLSWSQSGWLGGVTSGSVGGAKGLPVFFASQPHATELSRVDGDPDFAKITIDAHRVQPLTDELSLSLSAAGQRAFNGLLAGEEFALGGYVYGRGFDPAALAGDDGLGGTAELHYDPAFLGIDGLDSYLFYDRGAIWNHDIAKRSALRSAGLGVRIPLSPNVDVAVEAARRLYGPVPSVLPDLNTRLFLSLMGRF